MSDQNIELQLTTNRFPQVFQPFYAKDMYRILTLCLFLIHGWSGFIYGIDSLISSFATLLGYVLVDGLIHPRLKKTPFLVIQSLYGGLLTGAILPPGIGFGFGFFLGGMAVGSAKWLFGGFKGIWVHPAFVVFLFLSLSGGQQFQSFLAPLETPADFFASSSLSGLPPADSLIQVGYLGPEIVPIQAVLAEAKSYGRLLDEELRAILNRNGLSQIGVQLPPGYISSFLGFEPSFIGGTSVALMLILSVFLIGGNYIRVRPVVWFLLVSSFLYYVFGDLFVSGQLFQGDVLFFLTTGGVLFTGYLIIGDLTISPKYGLSQDIFGILTGILVVIFRIGGIGTYGAILSVTLVSLFQPLLDKACRPKQYGLVKGIHV